jgi:hypothetical protein
MGFFDYFVNLPVSIADSVSSLLKNTLIKPNFISNKSQERLSLLAFPSIENITTHDFIFANFYSNMFHHGSSSG